MNETGTRTLNQSFIVDTLVLLRIIVLNDELRMLGIKNQWSWLTFSTMNEIKDDWSSLMLYSVRCLHFCMLFITSFNV